MPVATYACMDLTALPHVGTAERGFSIIEALIAAAILATALVALAQVLAVATTAATHARDMTHATLAATQKIEELRSIEVPASAIGGTDIVDGRLERQWSVTPLTGGAGIAIAVEVASPFRLGPPVRLVTIHAGVADDGE